MDESIDAGERVQSGKGIARVERTDMLHTQQPQTNHDYVVALPGGTLYPFQADGTKFIHAHRGNAIIGDERGLGKTAEALAWLFYQPKLRPAIIVCPAPVKLQWLRETIRWLGENTDNITVIKGQKKRPFNTDIVIINYDVLNAHLKALQELGPKVVIYDECQRLKNRKAARSKAAVSLSQTPTVISRIGLTGTMFLNRPREGWHQIYCINPYIWPKEYPYLMRYCNPTRVHTTAQRGDDGKVLHDDNGGVKWNEAWDFSGASHTDELNRKLRELVLIRRTKADVNSQLPKLQRVTLPLECDLSDYEATHAEVRVNLRALREKLRQRRKSWSQLDQENLERALADDAEADSLIRLYGLAAAEIARLRKAAGLAKVEEVLKWAEDFLDEGTPLLLFAHHHDAADAIVAGLNGKLDKDFKGRWPSPVPPPVDGRMTQKNRMDFITQFQQKAFPIMVAGLTAMSEGVDGLQYAANHLAFAEVGWNPAIHDQGEGRLDRQGQTLPVTSYYLLAQNTIDESMARVIDAKGTVTSASHGELPPPGILESLMEEIIGDR